jgi:hypothetical protein
MIELESTELCSHTTLDNGIHVFSFQDNSHRAIDEWITTITHLYVHEPQTETARWIVDLRESGALPMSYTFRKVREVRRAHPVCTLRPLRVALYHRSATAYESMQHTLFNVMRAPVQIKLCRDKDYADSFGWLLRAAP